MVKRNMSKVVFLDFDGVLNTGRWYAQMDADSVADEYGSVFDPLAVANLERILTETDAEIVVSSSWKFMGLAKMRDMWKDRNLPGKVIGLTPNSVSDEFLLNADLDYIELLSIRGQEIKEWLTLHGKDVGHYVILDDTYDILPEQKSHFVLIDPNVGITEDDAEKAIAILNGSQV